MLFLVEAARNSGESVGSYIQANNMEQALRTFLDVQTWIQEGGPIRLTIDIKWLSNEITEQGDKPPGK